MSARSPQNLDVVVNTLDQLFNEPDANPFSENQLEILGVSGLAYIVRQLQAHRRDWKTMRLHIHVPREEITPGFELRLTDAIRRYCRAKIDDNRLEIHLIRSRSAVGLGLALIIVLAVIACVYLLFTGLLSGTSQVIQLVVAATVSVFAYVSLWDPLEALLFSPIELMRENFILRRLIELEVVVKATAPPGSQDGAVDSQPFGADAPTTSRSSG